MAFLYDGGSAPSYKFLQICCKFLQIPALLKYNAHNIHPSELYNSVILIYLFIYLREDKGEQEGGRGQGEVRTDSAQSTEPN